MIMEWKIVGGGDDYLDVAVKYRGYKGKIRMPRPLFEIKTVRHYSMLIFNNIKKTHSMRVSLEDVFVEGWMRHFRSRLDYWYGWWSKQWKGSKVDFPIEVIASAFFPKCADQGTNSVMQNKIRLHMAKELNK